MSRFLYSAIFALSLLPTFLLGARAFAAPPVCHLVQLDGQEIAYGIENFVELHLGDRMVALIPWDRRAELGQKMRLVMNSVLRQAERAECIGANATLVVGTTPWLAELKMADEAIFRLYDFNELNKIDFIALDRGNKSVEQYIQEAKKFEADLNRFQSLCPKQNNLQAIESYLKLSSGPAYIFSESQATRDVTKLLDIPIVGVDVSIEDIVRNVFKGHGNYAILTDPASLPDLALKLTEQCRGQTQLQ